MAFFWLVLNFRNLNISGLLGDLDINVFKVSCLYYYNAADQPKPAQNQPKTSPKFSPKPAQISNYVK